MVEREGGVVERGGSGRERRERTWGGVPPLFHGVDETRKIPDTLVVDEYVLDEQDEIRRRQGRGAREKQRERVRRGRVDGYGVDATTGDRKGVLGGKKGADCSKEASESRGKGTVEVNSGGKNPGGKGVLEGKKGAGKKPNTFASEDTSKAIYFPFASEAGAGGI